MPCVAKLLCNVLAKGSGSALSDVLQSTKSRGVAYATTLSVANQCLGQFLLAAKSLDVIMESIAAATVFSIIDGAPIAPAARALCWRLAWHQSDP
jgi:hypothetical protein